MTPAVHEALEAWKALDRDAAAAQAELTAAWTSYDGGGRPPTADLMAKVSDTRNLANSKLAEVLELMKRATGSGT